MRVAEHHFYTQLHWQRCFRLFANLSDCSGQPLSRAARWPWVLSAAPLSFLSPRLALGWPWAGLGLAKLLKDKRFNFEVTYLQL